MLLLVVLLFFAPENIRGKADAYFRAKRYVEAANAYILLLQTAPNDPQLLDGAGRSFLAMGDPEHAIPFLERETAVLPLNLEPARMLSQALLATGRFEAAHKILTRITALDPSDAQSWARLGLLLYRNGYYPATLDALDKALTSKAGLASLENRNRLEVIQAISLVEAGFSEKAAQVIPPLLARPENAADLDLLLISVRLFYEKAQFDNALAASARALSLAPANAMVHFWRARIFQQTGDLTLAVSEAERSRELSPASPAPRGLLVRLYQKSGRGSDADREAAWLKEHQPALQ